MGPLWKCETLIGGLSSQNAYVFYWYGWLWYFLRVRIYMHLGASHHRLQGTIINF